MTNSNSINAFEFLMDIYNEWIGFKVSLHRDVIRTLSSHHQRLLLVAHTKTKWSEPIQRLGEFNRQNRLLHPSRLRCVRLRVPGPRQFGAWGLVDAQRELPQSDAFVRSVLYRHIARVLLYVRIQVHSRQEELLPRPSLGNLLILFASLLKVAF